mmetsp:Transcript_13379/g.21929  ORF Transcript_13379/g.21929 Transcript_13379/m.21929 type:complete len:258 (+) Transcript_13379:1229-2002(+)
MRWDALFQRPQDSPLPARGGGGGDHFRQRMLDSDDDYEDEDEEEGGVRPGHVGAVIAPRIGSRRLLIASSMGDREGESRSPGGAGSGSGAGSGPGGGTSALGSAQHNTVVYRSNSQPQPLQSGGGSPVATLLTEVAGSRLGGGGTGGSGSNSSFRFSTMNHSPPSLSSSTHVSSQRLVSSGHSSLGGSVTDSMDDIDEVVDSAAARAAFISSSSAAGAVAGRQLSFPTNTTYLIRSSDNGSASTVVPVPVVNPPPQP